MEVSRSWQLAASQLTVVLINADDQKFGYAAIFCAMTTLIGVVIAVAPVGMRWLAERVLAKRDQDAAIAEKGQRRVESEDRHATQ